VLCFYEHLDAIEVEMWKVSRGFSYQVLFDKCRPLVSPQE